MRLEWQKPGEGGPPLGSLVGVALVLTAVVGAAWLLLELPTPVCRLREWTGVPCPTCGSTRMARVLLRGDVGGALRSNPLVFVALSCVALWAVCSAVTRCFGLPTGRLRLEPVERRLLLVAAAVIVAANWAYLIVRGG